MKRKQIPVSLNVELLAAIENMAKVQKRTRSNMIETLLENAIAENRVEYRETRQLASLDRIERTRDTRPRKYRKEYQEIEDMPLDTEETSK